jgi:hypothetical protein
MAAESSRLGVTQTIAYDGNTAVTNAFGAQTYQVRLASTSACNYEIGDGVQTASSADPFLPANVIEYVTVSPGQRISAIKSPTNGLVTATAGTLYITEIV